MVLKATFSHNTHAFFLFLLIRFTAVAETDLKDPLKALGITDMFDESKSNFAKITSKLFY